MKEYFLEEENGHKVFFAEHGNPKGVPILSLHGGPGSKSKKRHVDIFDLDRYRVIRFDQRGCGKSTPGGEVRNNTTEDLLHDAERIREFLGIETWFVSGGSWGSTLALLYAIKHPDRVNGILLTAVYLGDFDSTKWSMKDEKGLARLMPDVWEKRMQFFNEFNIDLASQDKDIFKLLTEGDKETQKKVAAGVANWEQNLFSSQSSISYTEPEDVTQEDIDGAKIFVHYEMNDEFISDNFILDNIKNISNIPTVIVHGRYDILCPLEKAYALCKKLEKCELVIADSSGHKLTVEGQTIQKMAFSYFLEKNS